MMRASAQPKAAQSTKPACTFEDSTGLSFTVQSGLCANCGQMVQPFFQDSVVEFRASGAVFVHQKCTGKK